MSNIRLFLHEVVRSTTITYTIFSRNTLFNDQSDQAAAFAELFATGARCEAYFDVTPSAFGKLLSDRYRFYHHKSGHEPPLWSDQNPATPSAYAAAKIDIDDNYKRSSISGARNFTFLSVFAIPALIDILLLTSTGRGLYLSYRMSNTERHAATLALMVSLLISGAVGTWITCGGSYYLISMAFSAMNMFVVTRLVTGLAFTLVAAVIGFAILCGTDGIASGVVFFLYLVALTSYLCLLAALANFQYPGSAFQSVCISLKIASSFNSLTISGTVDHYYVPSRSIPFSNHNDLDPRQRYICVYICYLYISLIARIRYTIHRLTMDNLVLEY